MAKMDLAHRETDKLIEELEKRIDETYTRASKETQAKLEKYMKSFEEKDAKKRKEVKDGTLSKKDYNAWRTGQIMTGKRWEEMSKTLSQDLAHAEYIAQKMTKDTMMDAYALNHNYATYEVEHGSMVDTSYTLYDHDTVERLIKEEPQLLPGASKKVEQEIREGKLIRWNQQKITSEVTQGILQGESVDTIAKRMRNVATMDRNASRRNARTSVTGAQNAGRQDSYERAQEMGIDLVKTWLATMDDRTRHWHVELDGVSVPVDESFENEYGLIEYPGDPNADPANVYNCRCTMISTLKGFEKDFSDRHNDALGDMSYDDWKQMHESEKAEESAQDNTETPIENSKAHDDLMQMLENSNIKYREVEDLDKELTSDEIIEKIGGGDLTKGSCSSLTYAYIGNECGYDVYDFRDGESRKFFASSLNEGRIRDFNNIEKQVFVIQKGEAKGIANKLNELNLPYNEEYRLCCGKHAAIIRNTEQGYQYLELQNAKNNGWKSFTEKEVWKFEFVDGKIKEYTVTEKCSVEETLRSRFGCRASAVKRPILDGETGKLRVDENGVLVLGAEMDLTKVSSYKNCDEFKDILGYINTDPKKQKKGVKGYAK